MNKEIENPVCPVCNFKMSVLFRLKKEENSCYWTCKCAPADLLDALVNNSPNPSTSEVFLETAA
jgi:hypothetical protein